MSGFYCAFDESERFFGLSFPQAVSIPIFWCRPCSQACDLSSYRSSPNRRLSAKFGSPYPIECLFRPASLLVCDRCTRCSCEGRDTRNRRIGRSSCGCFCPDLAVGFHLCSYLLPRLPNSWLRRKRAQLSWASRIERYRVSSQ